MATPLKSGPAGRVAPWPWATAAIAVLALMAFASDRLAGALIYERGMVLQGEVWRLWTGNVVHFTPAHLLWNLAVVIPAGIWLERIAPKPARWLIVLAPAMIGGAVFAFDPALIRYAGLSGVAAALLALLAFTQLGRPRTDRWFWWAVLALLGLKIAVEIYSGRLLLVKLNDPGFRTVPLAHVVGVAAAAFVHGFARRI